MSQHALCDRPSFVVDLDVKVSIDQINDVAFGRKQIVLSDRLIEFVSRGRDLLVRRVDNNDVMYGINTGFGGNANILLPHDQLREHQDNLLVFLTAGTGPLLDSLYVRASQFLTLLALSRGWSGVRSQVLTSLCSHLNANIVPLVPSFGSVGASGDLIPSSYIASALCGRGQVYYEGECMDASSALEKAGIPTLLLEAKEGLALVNGTRVMTSVAALTLHRFQRTANSAVAAIALVAEAMRASNEHFDRRIHHVKNHGGPIMVAEFLHAALEGSLAHKASVLQAYQSSKFDRSVAVEISEAVQEVYSIRCAPQIIGVVFETIAATQKIVETEAISVNDNPLIDPNDGSVLQGGNFMGQHISRAMDAIKIDIAIVANHMHSLTALLMDKRFSRGLPNSLVSTPGVSQGLKGLQISQTALVASIRQQSSPSSVHTLTTEQYNQDFVSLGLHASQSASLMEQHLRDVVSMSLITACQALDLRGLRSGMSDELKKAYDAVRLRSKFINKDRPLDTEIRKVSEAIEAGLIGGDISLKKSVDCLNRSSV